MKEIKMESKDCLEKRVLQIGINFEARTLCHNFMSLLRIKSLPI